MGLKYKILKSIFLNSMYIKPYCFFFFFLGMETIFLFSFHGELSSKKGKMWKYSQGKWIAVPKRLEGERIKKLIKCKI